MAGVTVIEHIDTKEINEIMNPGGRNMLRAVTRLMKIGERAAKADYKNKRKSKGPSSIISSFVTSSTMAREDTVVGHIMSGGPQAPYVVWVDQGHRLRNGNWWEGYHFMDAADVAVEENMERVFQEEFNR